MVIILRYWIWVSLKYCFSNGFWDWNLITGVQGIKGQFVKLLGLLLFLTFFKRLELKKINPNVNLHLLIFISETLENIVILEMKQSFM